MDNDAIEKRRAYDREWKRQYKLKFPDKVKEKRRERYNREKKNPDWLQKHKKYMRAYQKKWEKDNQDRLVYRREWMKTWHRRNAKEIYKRRRQKPYEQLASNIRSRIKDALKFGRKSAKTEELLGISIQGLKTFLELKFKPGMSWENYGKWHIDHIYPLSKSDLTTPEGQKRAFHYTNLQPLWAKENISKGARVL